MNPTASDILWSLKAFNQLSAQELYDIIHLREKVFVVEQDCVYLDADGVDPACYHLSGRRAGDLIAYLRVVPPGVKYAGAAALGRVVTDPAARGGGAGKALMLEGIKAATAHFPGHDIKLSGQQYLERFYQNLGFETISEPYLEDNIPHVAMLRPWQGE